MSATTLPSPMEQAVFRKIAWRIAPILMLSYFGCYLDRANVGFAALTMNQDLGLTATAYGFGAGIFYFGYALVEVPSNLILARVGARRWLARIMASWAIISGLTAFVWNDTSFFVLRFLLGVAEAGFAPGIIYYLACWTPRRQRGRMVALSLVSATLSGAIGSPVSGWVISSFGGVAGLASWQWLFLLEALPSLVMAVVVFLFLRDTPNEAPWLEPAERDWLNRELAVEQAEQQAQHSFSVLSALIDRRVLGFCLVYFTVSAGSASVSFWAPQIVKGFGVTVQQVGWLLAVPNLVAAAGMVVWARHSDRTGERRFHVLSSMTITALGVLCATVQDSPLVAMTGITLATFGTWATVAVFWTLPTSLLTGAAAAGAVALINSLGNLGGFFGPSIVGWVKDLSDGSYTIGMVVVAVGLMAGGSLAVRLGRFTSRRSPAETPPQVVSRAAE
jgi:MFS transporter, ACS family, tartrate transporter